jgi:hypothetical protein
LPAKIERPALAGDGWREAAGALQAYVRVLGAVRAALTPPRKLGWHAGIALQARGVTTTPVPLPDGALEARIDFLDGHVALLDSAGRAERWYLNGMPAARLAERIENRIRRWGGAVDLEPRRFGDLALGEGSQRDCRAIFRALLWADTMLKALRARQRRETSPVQLRPHHFDVSLTWLSGRQVPEEHADDGEPADERMDFGFMLGERGERPCVYATCHPLVDAFRGVGLPAFARWQEQGWRGVRIEYDGLREGDVADTELLALLERLRDVGETALGRT